MREMELCPRCEGSGEGMWDGSVCRYCRGKGEVPAMPEDDGDYRGEDESDE